MMEKKQRKSTMMIKITPSITNNFHLFFMGGSSETGCIITYEMMVFRSDIVPTRPILYDEGACHEVLRALASKYFMVELAGIELFVYYRSYSTFFSNIISSRKSMTFFSNRTLYNLLILESAPGERTLISINLSPTTSNPTK